jgi:glucose-6-phosphate isomerase
MVGHYWLRNANLAPSNEIEEQITSTLLDIKKFASNIHTGVITNSKNEKFKHLLIIGIGGSALGPQFVSQALRTKSDPLDLYFFDNTDPDGMQRVLEFIPDISKTLVIVISKSGGTKETRNGQLVAKKYFEHNSYSVSNHFIAITGEGSELYKTADSQKWLKIFPMWDWVGGRTSELSAVGLLPAALQGFDIDSLLSGACQMDVATREQNHLQNPAMLLALCWHKIGEGKGKKDMVILPYKDRLELFSRYLQQLVMESLGKEKDLDGKIVNQGLAVYGNKGSTDQHAYVQQLRDGVPNFFAVFIEVLKSSNSLTGFADKLEVETNITSNDYLLGFYHGTREALSQNGRESITLTVDEVNAKTIGMLIALFERAVSFYASLVNINAYHQPGVEAGKIAAGNVLKLQTKVFDYLGNNKGWHSIDNVSQAISENNELVFHILRNLAANNRIETKISNNIFDNLYSRG